MIEPMFLSSVMASQLLIERVFKAGPETFTSPGLILERPLNSKCKQLWGYPQSVSKEGKTKLDASPLPSQGFQE